jgi:transposase-like protein
MTLPEVNSLYSTDERCRELLTKLRWPLGVECVRCKSKKVYDLPTQKKHECGECGYQFSVLTQTIFNDTHLPLETWFMAVLLLVEARKGMSANQIKRTLGISYKTAWYLCHRIRAAMKEVNPEPLDGILEIDETFVGGKARGKNWKKYDNNKTPVIGIKQRAGELRFFKAEDVKSGTLAKYIKDNVSEDVHVIMTDEWPAYPSAIVKAGLEDTCHLTVNHRNGVYVDGDITTNGIESAFSLLKRGIIGSWHKVSAKHLPAYLDEMTFRFNNRSNPFLFRDTMMKLLEAPVLEYKKLTAA